MPNPLPTHHLHGRLLTPALGGLVLGTALQLQQAELFSPGAYGAVLAMASLALLAVKFSAQWLRVVWVVVMLAALAWALTGLRASVFDEQALEPVLQGRDLAVVGVVSAMPQRNATGLRFRFQVESATLSGTPVRLPPQLYLGWYGSVFSAGVPDAEETQRIAELRAGERWQLTLRLKAPHGGSNPHGFDFELWLWEQGLQATGYVRSGAKDPPPLRLGSTWQYPVEQLRQQVRDSIFNHLSGSVFPPERSESTRRAGIVAALVVGDQRVIDRADWDLFRATGVAHLMAISGLHITLFAWIAALLLGWLWRRSSRLCLAVPAPNAAMLGGLILASAYAVFSGWGVPSQRTIWMLLALSCLQWSGKRWPWPRVWLLAAATVLLIDPWALLQAGFWLSFVAVGILFASAAGSQLPADTGIWPRVRTMWREQLTITLALSPLTLLLFGQVSLLGLLANLVAIPWVTLVVTPLALLGVLWAPLWSLAAWGVQLLAGFLQFLAAWPLASVSVAQPALWLGVAGVLGALLVLLRLP
ncbi:MAG: ComEC/Rec2 family competence protein, partial [Burkholderiaceae bacterium]